MESLPNDDLSNWKLLLGFLPENWESLGRESGALLRMRGFPDAECLLRTLLVYLVEGRSLKHTALRAEKAGLTSVSSVAIWKRLKQSGEWFRLMNEALLGVWCRRECPEGLLAGRRIRLVDGTTVSEPGKTGSCWRIHYSIDLATLRCDYVRIFEKSSGETFRRFEVTQGDVLIGDRVYANRPGIRHVISHGGDAIVRLPYSNVPLANGAGSPVDMLAHLRTLDTCDIGEWHWCIPPADDNDEAIPVRVCAVKKSETAAEIARKKILRTAQKSNFEASPEALEAAGYFIVLTTLPQRAAPAAQVLELYRGRWQIELVFKRLKSILHLGHLPKKEPDGARAWLQGKLFIASLTETLIAAGEDFSPWGYLLGIEKKPLAGDRIHV
ncbi:MAG: IS4 family transposase [Candidatus Hydrogenedentes bacterium]|nr:IS4 family transposase [Candidatus Hydrogenedentota bacterium]